MTYGIQALFFTLFFSGSVWAVDSGLAENQVEICDSDLSKVRHALGVKIAPDKERYTGFFDTPSLELYQRHFYVRVRRTDKKVKIAFKKNEPNTEILKSSLVDCETDVHVDYSKKSCTYESDLSLDQFKALKARPQDWQKIFSAEAISAFQLLSDHFSDFPRLEFLGEVLNHKWELRSSGGVLNLDVWFMPPHQEPMMEVSIRSSVQDSPQVFPDLYRDLQKKGLSLCHKSQGRTKTLLLYLTSH